MESAESSSFLLQFQIQRNLLLIQELSFQKLFHHRSLYPIFLIISKQHQLISGVQETLVILIIII